MIKDYTSLLIAAVLHNTDRNQPLHWRIILFVTVSEEAVECRHDLRTALAEELAEAVLAVLLTLFCIVENSSGAVGFVDSATQR